MNQANEAKLSEESRIVCLRFGNDAEPACMEMDEKLFKIADAVKEWAVVYVVDNRVNLFSLLIPLYPSVFLNPHLPILLQPCIRNRSLTLPPASPRLQRHVRNLRPMYRHVLLAQ
jgi:hypothetical protein